MRMSQYFTELNAAMQQNNSKNIDDFISRTAGITDLKAAAHATLNSYSQTVTASSAYRREYIRPPDIKSGRELDLFDCIAAPCMDACATRQDIPDYLWHTSQGDIEKAFGVILRTNPFPSVTGMVCDHLCQGKCTRIN
jgi:putative selenate reductase